MYCNSLANELTYSTYASYIPAWSSRILHLRTCYIVTQYVALPMFKTLILSGNSNTCITELAYLKVFVNTCRIKSFTFLEKYCHKLKWSWLAVVFEPTQPCPIISCTTRRLLSPSNLHDNAIDWSASVVRRRGGSACLSASLLSV